MKRPFSRSFDPPAPVLDFVVRPPGEDAAARVEAKIDTGADLSAVPLEILLGIDAPLGGTVRVAGFGGTPITARYYWVDLEAEGLHLPSVKVVATGKSYALLGRNATRRLVLTLDGPSEMLEVTKGGKRRGRTSR